MCRIRPPGLIAKIAAVKRALETSHVTPKALADEVGLMLPYLYKLCRELGYEAMHVSKAERRRILDARKRAAKSK